MGLLESSKKLAGFIFHRSYVFSCFNLILSLSNSNSKMLKRFELVDFDLDVLGLKFCIKNCFRSFSFCQQVKILGSMHQTNILEF